MTILNIELEIKKVGCTYFLTTLLLIMMATSHGCEGEVDGPVSCPTAACRFSNIVPYLNP